MLRRLYSEQPDSFAFTPANQAWAEEQLKKYPEGRQASAIIPLLWRAQEQEGWLSRPAIEHIADMLGMSYIRALEVATFYFMFQLQPVGSVAHIQVCGTTSCMLCGAEDLISICQQEISANPHDLSADGKFSWEEVECLGACTNAPMAQIGKDYYEDLTADSFRDLLTRFAKGDVPTPGPQNGRFSSEPLGGATVLTDKSGETYNGSVARAVALGDTIKRIDGTETALRKVSSTPKASKAKAPAKEPKPAKSTTADETGITKQQAKAKSTGSPVAGEGVKPATLAAARDGGPDDLKMIKGVGPKLEKLLHKLGFFHFDQVAGWSQDEVSWVDQNLEGFKGRVSRDGWVDQAKILAKGGTTDFSKKVKKGDVY